MKKSLLLCLLAFECLICFGQETTEHLTFMGVPIDGPRESFVSKLEAKGCKIEFIDKRTTILSGNFFGYGDCVIAVHSLAYQNLVCGTVVVFPTKNKWSQLYSNYASVKNGLIRKYGIPSECTEKFTGRYEPTSDSEKIYFVHHDRCNYSTSFTTKNGSITVSISCLHDNEANVLIGYYDKINAKKEADESDDDL